MKKIYRQIMFRKKISKGAKALVFILLLLVVIVISTLVYTETRDNLTYSTLTNCEANIKKRLISPKSFEFISDKVGESNLEKYNYKYLTDFSKTLLEMKGMGLKKYL